VIIAGAQAIYLRTGDAELAVAPYTSDGDLALDPTILADDPRLEDIMTGAGFVLLRQRAEHIEPGIWLAPAVVAGEDRLISVDLIVPEGAASGPRSRGARLGAHGKRAARRVLGLEAALVDHTPMHIQALDSTDKRSVNAEVAGVAALFVAKAHKLHDRLAAARPHRLHDKDAADVIRLMQTTVPADVAKTLAQLCEHEIAGAPTRSAIGYLVELFGERRGTGIRMAANALQIAMPGARVTAIATGYMQRLTAALPS
jgi:hypothetical protein